MGKVSIKWETKRVESVNITVFKCVRALQVCVIHKISSSGQFAVYWPHHLYITILWTHFIINGSQYVHLCSCGVERVAPRVKSVHCPLEWRIYGYGVPPLMEDTDTMAQRHNNNNHQRAAAAAPVYNHPKMGCDDLIVYERK